MTFVDLFIQSLHDTWQVYYLVAIMVSLAMALALQKATRGAVLFTLQVLMLFAVLLIGSVIAASVDAGGVAGMLAGLAVLVLGMLLIRQVGLLFFRRIIPKLGFQPPRILEEIIILIGYVGWIMARLASAGLDLGSLVASTAVITAVLAFAMQDTLGNILSGLALQLDHSVNIGDWVELDGVTGQVEQVQWRHTAVRTLFGDLILVPNSRSEER